MTRKPVRKVRRLRKLRRDREWTQQQVARRVGASAVAICAYENGTRTPSVRRLQLLSDVFGVPMEALLDEVEIPA